MRNCPGRMMKSTDSRKPSERWRLQQHQEGVTYPIMYLLQWATTEVKLARYGKAPPIDPFTGEDAEITLDDWLPSLKRAALDRRRKVNAIGWTPPWKSLTRMGPVVRDGKEELH